MLNLQFPNNKTPETDFFKKSWDTVLNNSKLGFLKTPAEDLAWSRSAEIGQVLKNNYDHLVVIGIGGSSMGSRCFAEYAATANITFLDNVDTQEILTVQKLIQTQARIAWLFVSKSGTTVEVLWNLDMLYQFHLEIKKDFWSHTFFITELTQNTLHQLSLKYDRPCLEIPIDVGGRFSVLTPVGLVVASYLNLNLALIREGAALALTDRQNTLNLSATYLNFMEKGHVINSFWFYSSRMRWFGQWLQQLWAESLGKKTDRSGQPAFVFSTPLCCIGATDQHSVLQQLIDGPKDKFTTIFRFKSVEKSLQMITNPLFQETKMMAGLDYGSLMKAETLATHQALSNQGLNTLLIKLDQLDEKALGYLFMLHQLIIAVMAEAKNINAFDQPAVEHGKKLIRDFINS